MNPVGPPSSPLPAARPTQGAASGAAAPLESIRNGTSAATAAPGGSARWAPVGATAEWPLSVLEELCPGLVGEVRREVAMYPRLYAPEQREQFVERLVNRIQVEVDRLPAERRVPGPQQINVSLFVSAVRETGRNALYVAAWEAGTPPPPGPPGEPLPPNQWDPRDPLSTRLGDPMLRHAQILFRIHMR